MYLNYQFYDLKFTIFIFEKRPQNLPDGADLTFWQRSKEALQNPL